MTAIDSTAPDLSATAKPDTEFKIVDVSATAVAHGINDSFFAIIPTIQPLLMDKLGLSLTQAGMFSLFLQVPSLLQPYIGRQADRRNLFWLVILAPTLSAVLLTFTGYAPSYGFLALLMLGAGFSTAGFHAIAPVLAASRSGNKIGRGMGLFMVGGELGYGFGPLLAVAITTALGLAGLPWLIPLGALCSFLLYQRFKHLTGVRPKQNTDPLPLAEALRHMSPIILPIMGYIFITSFLAANMINFLPTFLTSEGFSLVKAGAAFSLVQVSGTVGVLASSWLSDRIGQKKVIFGVTLIIPAFALLFLYAPVAWRIPLLSGAGLLAFSANPAFLALMQRHFPRERSLANGVYMASGFVIRSLVVILVGVLADRYGIRPVFTASAWSAFLALPLVLLLPGESAIRGLTR